MHTYTALYETRNDAEQAQRQLTAAGIVEPARVQMVNNESNGFVADRSQDNRSFWESLKDVFLPDDDRAVYEESVRQGAWLLTVNVDDTHSQHVHQLLEATNAINVDEREQQYRQAGTLAMKPAVAATHRQGEQAIPIVQEQVRVGKRQVEKGGVRVRSYMVETPVRENVSLREESVSVERRPVNQPIAAANVADGLRDRSIEMTASKEEAVVAKDARIVEEVVVRKNVGERVEQINETVRHTEVDVQRVEAERQAGAPRTNNAPR